MIQIFLIPDHSFTKARCLRPQITATGEREYELVSSASGKTYHLILDDEVEPCAFSCDCPAKTYCWHAAAILDYHARRMLAFGDRALVNESNGEVWHTVLYANDRHVFTDEIRDGFSLSFVIAVERAISLRCAA